MEKLDINSSEQELWVYRMSVDLLLMGIPYSLSQVQGVLKSALEWAEGV